MKRTPVIFLLVIIACLFVSSGLHFLDNYTKPIAYVAIDPKTIPDGDNVWYIGDSYSDNTYMRAKINETFGNIFVDVQSGKRFARDLAGNPAGTTLLRKYVATGRKPTYLIYELDTNDSDLSSAEAAQEIAELREILGSDTYIILMTAHSIAYDNDAFNSAVWRASANDDRILVADWQGAIQGQETTYISSDLLHPNATGHDLLVKLFKEQLDRAVSLAQS